MKILDIKTNNEDLEWLMGAIDSRPAANIAGAKAKSFWLNAIAMTIEKPEKKPPLKEVSKVTADKSGDK